VAAEDLLPRQPLLTGALVAEQLNCSARGARGALLDLTNAGILAEHLPGGPRAGGQPPRLDVSPELLALAGSSPLR